MRARRSTGVLTGLLVAAGLAGCSVTHGAGPAPSPQVITDDPALDAARLAFTTTHSAVLTEIGAVTGAAAALDSLDGQATKGAFDPAMRAQPTAVKKAAAARAALSRLPAALTSYAESGTELASVAKNPALTATQAAALRTLAASVTGEVATESALESAERKGWAAYVQLGTAQALWLMRADDGFYPGTNNDSYDAQRAGEAYVVLVNPVRSALTAERKALAKETAAVTVARASTAASLAAAGTAFR